MARLDDLVEEYDRARRYTDLLWHDLSEEEIRWRPHPDFSPIGWHLGHQAAVAHFLVRNLVAAEPKLDPDLEVLADSATGEPSRGDVPTTSRLTDFRSAVAERVHARIDAIDHGNVDAPNQLRVVGHHLLVTLVNHEYQHDQWISEVRSEGLGRVLPPRPTSGRLAELDGYTVLVL